MIYKIFSIIILLVLSAFFSSSETAIFSLDPITIRKIRDKGKSTKNIDLLLKNPLRLLSTILIGNMLVNVTISSLAGAIAISIWGDKGVGGSVWIMTFVLLLFGEVTPKRIAVEKYAEFSLFSSVVLIYLSKIVFPVYWFLNKVFGRFISLGRKEPTLTEEELKTIIDIGHREGIVAGHEKELIGAVLGFTDILVKDVMVKREDIKACPIDLTQEEFIRLAKEFKHSKIPVYKRSIDNIMGVVYAKELFLFPDKPFYEIMKPIISVSYNMKIKDVLGLFERDKIKIAIVLDALGNVSGLITMEDILEEVFGEIYDEFEILKGITE